MGSPRTTALSSRRAKGRRAKLQAALPVAGVVRALSAKAPPKRRVAGLARPSWKLLGLAGVAGVAATGVVVARNRRAHRDVEPDELRERLHERLAAAAGQPPQPPSDPPA